MLLGLLLFLAVPPAATPSGQDLLGDWVTVNKSIVRIYGCGSNLCIKVVRVDKAIGHTVDGENPDPAKRTQPLCGLVVGTGFIEKDVAHAEGGKLYDPESGNTYSGTITLTNASTLRLRGYMGLSVFGRTENWHRAPDTTATCG